MSEEKRIMDQGWVLVQKKTFTKWANNHIVKKFGKDAVLGMDLENQFETGENLMRLVNALYGIALPRYNKKPKMRPHKLDNVSLALNMLEKDAGVKTNFLKTTHLVDKDLKMILGMIWAIILHYQIQGISVEEMSAKEGLLLWCQRKTKGYRDVDPPTIRGFTTDWQNGMAFCALIHKHRPDLIDYDSLDKANARENLELAFSVAEKELGIPRLLDVEDLVDVARPDERSVITYVSEYFHCFANMGEADAAGRRIAGLVANARANDALKKQYAHDAGALRDWTVAKTEAHKARDFGDSLADVEGKWSEFTTYRADEKPPKQKAKLALEGQFTTLQTKLRVQGRPAFVPPSGLAPSDIDALWSTLSDEERARAKAIRDELERQQRIQVLVDRFTRRANALDTWSSAQRSFLGQADSGSDLASVQAQLKTLDGFEADYTAATPRLTAVKTIGDELVSLGYNDAATVTARMGTLDATWSDLRTLADQRRATLEAELARQQKLEDMRVDFGKRGRVFVNWVEDADILNETVRFNTLGDLQEFSKQFDEFSAQKGAKKSEFDGLVALANDMEAAGITSNVYAMYSIADITQRWEHVESTSSGIPAALDAEKARLAADDAACKEFAGAATEFTGWLAEQRAAVANVSGEPEAQVSALSKLAAGLRAEQGRVDALVALDNTVAQRGIINNPHSASDVDSLKLEYAGVVDNCTQQIQTLEKEMAKSTEQEGVSAAQMEEFKSVFAHFDSDGNNKLEKHEFKACLSGLGVSKTDDELEASMKEVGSDGVHINFEQFTQFMLKLNDTSDTADNMKEAFSVVAGGKSHVTEADLVGAGMSAEDIAYLMENLDKNGDGEITYAEWCDAQYA